MSDRTKLDWMVPAEEWKRFCDHVESQFGSLEGYLGREAELAMREYIDGDRYAELEETIDRLVQAAGRTPRKASKEKISDLEGSDTTRVAVRVHPEIRQEFKQVASAGQQTLGVAFARSIQTYRDGGRAGRLIQKVNRIADDAEALLSELDESDAESGLSKVKRNTIRICNRLNKQFTNDDLNREIHDVAGRGDRASEPTLEKYRDRVVDRLDVVPHPNKHDEVWVPEETAEQYAPDGIPRECHLPASVLDREERVRRIKLALGRRAKRRKNGFVSVQSNTIKSGILGNEVSKTTTINLMEQAANTDGFRLNGDSGTSLSADLSNLLSGEEIVMSELQDRALWEDVFQYADADADGLLSETTESTVDDWSSVESPMHSHNAQGNGLTGITTDGGGPSKNSDRNAE